MPEQEVAFLLLLTGALMFCLGFFSGSFVSFRKIAHLERALEIIAKESLEKEQEIKAAHKRIHVLIDRNLKFANKLHEYDLVPDEK